MIPQLSWGFWKDVIDNGVNVKNVDAKWQSSQTQMISMDHKIGESEIAFVFIINFFPYLEVTYISI